MSGATKKPGSMQTLDSLKKPQNTTCEDPLVCIVKEVIVKLQTNPSSITTEDARRLSENTVVGDLQTAKIISALEVLAASSATINQVNPTLGQAPHTSLPTIINDLKAAVDQNPGDVTTEVLRNAQNVVISKLITSPDTDDGYTEFKTEMQKAVGHTNAPHPELETQIQEEIAKIESKLVEGTVTIEEANHFHALEACAHGQTEKGGITSIAQSVVAKRERQLSLSSGSSPTGNRSRANSKTFTPQEQSHRDKEADFQKVADEIKPRIEQSMITEEDADLLHSRETCAHGQTKKGGLASSAQSVTSKKR
jgi:hypothetical protein